MRWLFLLVLALNIAYILTQINDPYPDASEVVSSSDGVETIILLKELEARKISAEHDSAESSPEDDSILAEGFTDGSISDDSESSAGVSSLSAQPSGVSDDAGATDAGVSDVDKTDVDEPRPEVLTEVRGALQSCFTYGPFRDLEVLLELKREIKPYVSEIEYRSREESERTTYWVHIKPAKNRTAAKATARKLKAKKIKDFYIVRSGENNNAISLGHFKSKKRASDLTKKLVKQGFDVIVEPVFKSYTLYWLDYQLASSAVIPESVDKKYAKKSAQENFSRLDRECD
jgi:hypothetical protein